METFKKSLLLKILILLLLPLSGIAEQISIQLTIPQLPVQPYHRPYLAIWLETPQRQGVQSLSVAYEKTDWLKDMRQWWRKLGRNDTQNYAAISGATRKPGIYSIQWDTHEYSTLHNGRLLPAGEYYLLFEAAREAGGRDFIRQKIELGKNQTQHYELSGKRELGKIIVDIRKN